MDGFISWQPKNREEIPVFLFFSAGATPGADSWGCAVPRLGIPIDILGIGVLLFLPGHVPFFWVESCWDELQPADVSGSWRLLRIKPWILVNSRDGHQWRAPRRGIWEWLEVLENHPGPFSGMMLCYNGLPLPPMGGNPGKLGLGRAKDLLFHLLWCWRIDPEELLRVQPCAPHPQLCSGDTLECPS